MGLDGGLGEGKKAAAAHQILSFVALKSRRPWCRKSPGLWKDLGPWSGPAQDGGRRKRSRESSGSRGYHSAPSALYLPSGPKQLFEIKDKEVGNRVVGPINAQTLAEAQQR